MKKLIFFIVLVGFALKLKAQEKPTPKAFENDTLKDGLSFKPVYPKSFINPEGLLKPKQNLTSDNQVIYAALDRMPIVKPQGKWNMPVVKPDGNYNMPIIGLPPVVKTDSTQFKP